MKKWRILGLLPIAMGLSVFPAGILAQKRPVKENFLAEYKLATPPAASCAEAYKLANCNDPNSSGCNTDQIDQELNDRLQKLGFTLSGVSLPASSPAEMEKKMAGMTDAQKQAVAMQMAHQYMQNTASSGGYQPESPAVIEAISILGQMNQEFAMRNSKPPFEPNDIIKMKVKYQAKMDATRQWYDAEYKKLPRDPDPKAVFDKDPAAQHQLEIRLAQKKVDIENAYLKEYGNLWNQQKGAYISMYSGFESALEKIHYGDEVRNENMNGNLAEGQKKIIAGILFLIGQTRDLDKEAAEYYKSLQDEKKK